MPPSTKLVRAQLNGLELSGIVGILHCVGTLLGSRDIARLPAARHSTRGSRADLEGHLGLLGFGLWQLRREQKNGGGEDTCHGSLFCRNTREASASCQTLCKHAVKVCDEHLCSKLQATKMSRPQVAPPTLDFR
jgi:hypothetical protein